MNSKVGKGLEGMFSGLDNKLKKSNRTANEVESNLVEVDIDSIIANSHQPRTSFEDEELLMLSASIKENGILQPLTVLKIEDNKYELIAGERRLRASKLAGFTKVPVIVKNDVDEEKKSVFALIENIQREDLNPIEISFHLDRMAKNFNLNQGELAQKVGLPRSNVANYLRLVNLPEETQDLLKNKKILFGHAKVLLSLKDEDKINELAEKVAITEMSVAKLSKLIKAIDKPEKEPIKKEDEVIPQKVSNFISNLENQKCNVLYKKKKLILSFETEEDLLKLVENLSIK